MTGLYLDALDDLLAAGLEGLSAPFVEAQIRFVVDRQQSDGGFSGRQGASDPYYTDFALRTLALLAPEHQALGRAASYVAHFAAVPRDVVECFNLLNARRILRRCGYEIAGESAAAMDVMRSQQAPSGGLARHAGEAEVSAYATFLGGLCCDCLREELPSAAQAVQAVAGLARPDQGFAELAGQSAAQTNATAAAVGFLRMHDGLADQIPARVGQFLRAMQHAEGGLQAHAEAGGADLLSTFTGFLTLTMLEQTDPLDLAAVARFVRDCASRGGGFRACAADPEADVEYTYYGLGTMALLRLHGTARPTE
jgi:geranylgeranyl transferase type-2 subunit beta